MTKKLFLIYLMDVAGLSAGYAQLSITEIMSSASTNLGPAVVVQNSDFWELTNFGTNTVDLTDYKWNDNAGGLIGADSTPFAGVSIGPGESIIFFESSATTSTNAEQFQAWWGLSPSVHCFPYVGNGLSSVGDGVVLWSAAATDDADFVDRVDFLAATRGQSFVYNPTTGIFDENSLSTNGVGGAFKAVTSDDVGSPGTTTGPLPLAILQQPTNAAVNPGDTAVFMVVASGLPRPTYQWQHDGVDLVGARSSTLSIPNSLSDAIGEYHAIVSNGADSLTSSNATLTLNGTPAAPTLLVPPVNQSVFIGQNAVLSVVASGVPPPAYQWRKEGGDIAGATSNSYTIGNVQLTDAGAYSVVIHNLLGALTNDVTLAVTRRPKLAITEIMPAQSTNGIYRGHQDWWELSNLDDFTVDLHGYRFDDSSSTLGAAVTFTNAQLQIAPGESIVFVEGMSANSFRSWWGPANLRGIQIVTYAGAGLGLSSLGDAIVVWNSGATDDADTIATEVFSTATNGVSFGYDPDQQVFGELSEVGVQGAFSARENGDLGSPGFIRNSPEPRILSFSKEATGYTLTWIGNPGHSYTMQSTSDLSSTEWNKVATVPAAGPIVTATDTNGGTDAHRFYRVRLEP